MALSKLINHPDHPQHHLTWKNVEEAFRCNGCKKKGLGPGYLCEQNSCNFYLHEECGDPDSSAFHRFIPSCRLKFYQNPPQMSERYCDACGKDIQGYVYQCTHRKPHHFHPQCLKLQHSLTDRRGNVTVQLKKKLPMVCFHCNSKKINHKIEGWCYLSSCGQYCYHIACLEELHLRSWKMGHLRRPGNGEDEENSNCVALEISFPSHRTVFVHRRAGSSSRFMKFRKMVVTVFKLIVTALFVWRTNNYGSNNWGILPHQLMNMGAFEIFVLACLMFVPPSAYDRYCT